MLASLDSRWCTKYYDCFIGKTLTGTNCDSPRPPKSPRVQSNAATGGTSSNQLSLSPCPSPCSVAAENQSLYIVMQYAPGGDVHHRLKVPPSAPHGQHPGPESHAARLRRQLAPLSARAAAPRRRPSLSVLPPHTPSAPSPNPTGAERKALARGHVHALLDPGARPRRHRRTPLGRASPPLSPPLVCVTLTRALTHRLPHRRRPSSASPTCTSAR